MEDLDAEQQRLAIQMNEDAEAVNVMIAENARVAQDQTEYNARFEELSVRAEESKARYNQITAEIAMQGIRRREFGRFIEKVENLPELITEFDEALWGGLVDHVKVYDKDNIIFILTSGIEIKA